MSLTTNEPTKHRLMSARANTSKIPKEISNIVENSKRVNLTIRNSDTDAFKKEKAILPTPSRVNGSA